jgi:hypothetical protein
MQRRPPRGTVFVRFRCATSTAATLSRVVKSGRGGSFRGDQTCCRIRYLAAAGRLASAPSLDAPEKSRLQQVINEPIEVGQTRLRYR